MGSNSPSVIVRLKYYEPESKGRDFYSSQKKDDYLNYVDKGIKDDGRKKPCKRKLGVFGPPFSMVSSSSQGGRRG